ncbi:AAA family ATPase [Streptomyces sp. NPDC004539]|uniref:ATP-binding protein n=1 Tax=Streptomyces sp. NPDC004539 TaxID=3154280 RepID=UPI0033AFD33C
MPSAPSRKEPPGHREPPGRGRPGETSRTAPPPHVPRPAPDFVGRSDQLAALGAALVHGPAFVVIEGEPGIGKSRLVREAVGGSGVLMAACPPLPEPFTLGAVVDGLRRLCPGPPSGLELSPLAGVLRPLLPDWAALLPPPPEGLDDPRATRHRILSALTELVGRLGVGVLVVEDAHWADTATLEWLLTLTATAHSGLSVVVTYRPDEVAPGSLLSRLTSRTPADVTFVRMALEPLDLAGTRALVASMFDAPEVSPEFVSFLHEHTDGVPLALEEYVLLLRDREDVVRRDGAWIRRVLGELRVPATLRDSVLERVARLDPGARGVLEAAAVLDAPSGSRCSPRSPACRPRTG